MWLWIKSQRRLLGVGVLLVAAGLGYVSFFVLDAEPLILPQRGYIDMHVHAAGLGYGDSGAFIGSDLRDSWKFGIYLRAFDVTEDELAAHGDRVLLEKLSENIAASQFVEKAVILAMDGVVDGQGELDVEKTQFYVPNAYLFEELARFDNLLVGASINPLRHDSMDRLERVVAQGAVLIKWIPNIMHINPGDERIKPFYRRMAELCMPLLTHTGAEASFGDADDSLGDPLRLELPLSMGVSVIAAHIATTGHIDGEAQFDRFLRMFEQYPNLYADISSLTQVNKLGYLRRALETPMLVPRLIYGSDWPLQFFPLVSPYYLLDNISLGEANTVRRMANVWDRDVAAKKYAGVPDDVFERFPTILQGGCAL